MGLLPDREKSVTIRHWARERKQSKMYQTRCTYPVVHWERRTTAEDYYFPETQLAKVEVLKTLFCSGLLKLPSSRASSASTI
jgi:hypothetical protein